MHGKTQQQSKQTAMIPLTEKERKQTTTAVIVHFGLNSVNSVSRRSCTRSMEMRIVGGWKVLVGWGWGVGGTRGRLFNNVFAGCVRGKALRVIHSDSPETRVQRGSQMRNRGARYIYSLKMAKPPVSCFPLLFGKAVTDNL